MVQLKVISPLVHNNPADSFQFLYGTIKSIPTPAVYVSSVTFQFLYGTIKSEKRYKGRPY